jgi:hypothetical protein
MLVKAPSLHLEKKADINPMPPCRREEILPEIFNAGASTFSPKVIDIAHRIPFTSSS